MFEIISLPTLFIDIFTLSGLEIILGIDNLIFVTLLVQKLDSKSRDRARVLGLSFALLVRIIILTFFSQILMMTTPLFNIGTIEFSSKSCLFILGGIFLLLKSAMDLIEMFFEASGRRNSAMKQVTLIPMRIRYNKIFSQIVLISIILSLDSVMAGVSLSRNLYAVASAIIISMGFVLLMSNKIARFVYKYTSLRVIALFFMMLLGLHMILSGLDKQFPKAYLYWAIAFSVIADAVNIKLNKLRDRNIHKKV
jgi:predicted tellurium resistance membrane protein TerC